MVFKGLCLLTTASSKGTFYRIPSGNGNFTLRISDEFLGKDDNTAPSATSPWG